MQKRGLNNQKGSAGWALGEGLQGGASAKALGQRRLLFQDWTQVEEKRSRKCEAFGRRGEGLGLLSSPSCGAHLKQDGGSTRGLYRPVVPVGRVISDLSKALSGLPQVSHSLTHSAIPRARRALEWLGLGEEEAGIGPVRASRRDSVRSAGGGGSGRQGGLPRGGVAAPRGRCEFWPRGCGAVVNRWVPPALCAESGLGFTAGSPHGTQVPQQHSLRP